MTNCGLLPYRASLQILDLDTRQEINLPAGDYREIIRREATPKGAFFTMTQEGDQLILRKRGADGSVIRRYELPLLDSVWISPNWCAINNVGSQLVYHDDRHHGMRLRNLNTGADRALPLGKVDSAVYISLLSWLDDGSFVMASNPPPDAPQSDYTDIHRYDIRTGAHQRVRVDEFYPFPYAQLSPDRRRMLYMHHIYGDYAKGRKSEEHIVIFDCQSMREVGRLRRPAMDRYICASRWMPDSRRIAFVERSTRKGDGHEELFVHDVARRSVIEGPLSPKTPEYVHHGHPIPGTRRVVNEN